MVIFAHEFGSVRSSCLRYCESLLDAGYDLFSFDFRGHGVSAPESDYRPRHWTSDREKADMLGAIAYVTSWLEEQGRPRAVGLFGISRGAGAAILSAEESNDVNAIVVDGAFSSDTLIEYMLKRFATTFARIQVVARNHPPFVWRVLRWMLFRDCARRFNCRFPSLRSVVPRLDKTPILFIHGEKDSYIPVAQSEDLFRLARGPKDLWIVKGAKHNQGVLTAPREYARRIIAFYDAHLATQPARQPTPTTVHFQLPPITAGVEAEASVFAGGALETARTM
jgi:pimeloyl-ACP methyl ester carboxylesterase